MKVIPKIPIEPDKVPIGTLKQGDCFIADNGLEILYDDDPKSVRLSDGTQCEWDEDYMVTVVKCTVTWVKKSSKKKK